MKDETAGEPVVTFSVTKETEEEAGIRHLKYVIAWHENEIAKLNRTMQRAEADRRVLGRQLGGLVRDLAERENKLKTPQSDSHVNQILGTSK